MRGPCKADVVVAVMHPMIVEKPLSGGFLKNAQARRIAHKNSFVCQESCDSEAMRSQNDPSPSRDCRAKDGAPDPEQALEIT